MAEKITKEDVIEFISNMTVLELSELVKELEDKFGVKASAPVMAMAGMAQAPLKHRPWRNRRNFL